MRRIRLSKPAVSDSLSASSWARLTVADYADEKTAAATARNATIGVPVDPSEAASTPTITVDIPPKFKTMPPPSDAHPSPLLTARDEHGEKRDKGHVMFVDTAIPSGILDHTPFVDSPVEGKLPTPLLRKKDLPHSLLATDGPAVIVSSPAQSAIDLHAKELGSGGIPAGGPTNELGDELPASAQMPSEIEANSKTETTRPNGASEDTRVNGTNEKHENQRKSTEQPEGTGSRRMFQLSKKFSTSLPLTP